MNRYLHCWAAALLVSLPGLVFAAPVYSVQDIGDLAGGENYSRALGMNALGEVVGESSMSYAATAETAGLLGFDFGWTGVRGFVWSQGRISEVGKATRLTGSYLEFERDGNPSTSVNNTWTLDIRTGASARAIDNSGNIYIESGRRGVNEFSLWPNGVLTSQEFFVGQSSIASRTIESLNGVNAVSGNGIVGGFISSGAATWSAQAGMRSLPEGTSSGSPWYWDFGVPSTVVNGVNDAGTAVGVSKGLPVWWDAQGQVHEVDALQPSPSTGYFDPCSGLPDCHALIITNPGLNSYFGEVSAINNFNAMVGRSSDGGFLWQDGQLTRLTNGSEEFNPTGINDLGDIVGSFSDGRAAIRLADGTYIDLNASVGASDGWTFIEAVAINSAGQIAANATRNGITHAFMLTPVPEPSGALMLLAGLSIFGLRHRRSQKLGPRCPAVRKAIGK